MEKSMVKTDLIGNDIVVSLNTCENWLEGETNAYENVMNKSYNIFDCFPEGYTNEQAELMKDETFSFIFFYGVKQKIKDGVSSIKDPMKRFEGVCKNLENLIAGKIGTSSAGLTKAQNDFLEKTLTNVIITLTKPEKIQLFMKLDVEKIKSYFITASSANVTGLKGKALNQELADKIVEDFVADEESLVKNCSK